MIMDIGAGGTKQRVGQNGHVRHDGVPAGGGQCPLKEFFENWSHIGAF